MCQNGITCDNWCVTGHGLKKMALVHVLTFLSNYDEMSRIIIKCQMVKTDKKLVYRSWLYSTYLGITVVREWQSRILILSPIQVLTRQYRLNKTTCIKATPLRGDSFLAETCHINICDSCIESQAADAGESRSAWHWYCSAGRAPQFAVNELQTFYYPPPEGSQRVRVCRRHLIQLKLFPETKQL